MKCNFFNTYETTRNLVSAITNSWNTATTLSAFDYTNDATGRRTKRDDSGTAFLSAVGGSSLTINNVFGYNARSEVTSATMRNGNSTYSFDQIGNRLDVSLPDEPNPVSYTSNALNQYSLVDFVSSVRAPQYDLDGNMTSDGDGKTLTWNGENRLIKIEEGDITVENTYDGQGRRVRKLVKDLGVVTQDLRYFYQGGNLLYEIDMAATGTPTRRYVWGLDLSQSMQGAGGVGGLLLTEADGTSHGVTYDANGNISEYIDLSDGSIDAHLEYDAFGRTIASTGSAPAPFGFSTKYQDTETGWYYYGFRYYDPETGRWPNRDPIGERGGLNLYGFVGNSTMGKMDPYGLSDELLEGLQHIINLSKQVATLHSREVALTDTMIKRYTLQLQRMGIPDYDIIGKNLRKPGTVSSISEGFGDFLRLSSNDIALEISKSIAGMLLQYYAQELVKSVQSIAVRKQLIATIVNEYNNRTYLEKRFTRRKDVIAGYIDLDGYSIEIDDSVKSLVISNLPFIGPLLSGSDNLFGMKLRAGTRIYLHVDCKCAAWSYFGSSYAGHDKSIMQKGIANAKVYSGNRRDNPGSTSFALAICNLIQ